MLRLDSENNKEIWVEKVKEFENYLESKELTKFELKMAEHYYSFLLRELETIEDDDEYEELEKKHT